VWPRWSTDRVLRSAEPGVSRRAARIRSVRGADAGTVEGDRRGRRRDPARRGREAAGPRMNPQIVWRPNAFDHMNAIVRAAPARKAEFAAALRELSAALTADAEGTGESREPPYRVAIFGEL